MGSSLHFRVWIISYVFVDNGSHERGQTSRPVVGADIQTNRNFDAHIYHCRYSLDCYRCRYSMQRVRFSYSALVWSNCHLMLPINLDCFICKDFPCSSPSSRPSTKSCSTTAKSTKCIEHGAIQKGSVQSWVQLVLLACYVPMSLVRIVMAHIKGNSSHLVVALGIANTLVYFNSTLNPFLYCWKISEVRRAVKQTIRQALCCPRG